MCLATPTLSCRDKCRHDNVSRCSLRRSDVPGIVGDAVRKLDWKLHDVVIAPVGRLPLGNLPPQ